MEPESEVTREIDSYVSLTDRKSVQEIYQECFPFPFTLRLLDTRISQSEEVWVYLLNNQIVGYLLLDNDRGVPYLSQVAVTSSARKKGVATGLIMHAEKYLRDKGASRWWLQTEVENPGQKLYFDLGFRVTAFSPDLYGLGKNGLEMTKFLQ